MSATNGKTISDLRAKDRTGFYNDKCKSTVSGKTSIFQTRQDAGEVLRLALPATSS